MIFTVAVDGPAASGKGTISRALAERFGFEHLDTGLLYRAVGAKVRDGAEPLEAAQPEPRVATSRATTSRRSPGSSPRSGPESSATSSSAASPRRGSAPKA